MTRVSDIALLFVIAIATMVINGDKLQEACCSNGQRNRHLPNSANICTQYKISVDAALESKQLSIPRGKENMCYRIAKICCLVSYQNSQCQKGAMFFIENKSCSSQSTDDSVTARECCGCCAQGHKDGSDGKDCRRPPKSYLRNCRNQYAKCCFVSKKKEEYRVNVTPESRRETPATHPATPEVTPPLTVATPPPTQSTPTTTYSPPQDLQDIIAEIFNRVPTTTTQSTTTRDPSVETICQRFEGRLCEHICVDDPTLHNKYRCQCKPGYVVTPRRHRRCTRVQGASEGEVTRTQCDDDCTYKCDVTRNQCYCSQGYQLASDGVSCMDINECITNTHQCYSHETCANIEGGYQCQSYKCPGGYVLSQDRPGYCEELNECLADSSICGHGSTCINVKGHYICRRKTKGGRKSRVEGCPEGYVLEADGRCHLYSCPPGYTPDLIAKTCIDDNECSSPDVCERDNVCINTPGSFECKPPSKVKYVYGKQCLPGLMMNEQNECVDIDECADSDNICVSMQMTCTNTYKAYLCSCDKGYRYSVERRVCEDIDECSLDVCSSDSTCLNSPGSYSCRCKDGFRAVEQKNQCIDINECSEGSHGCSDICYNLWGSYKCTCRPGYELDVDMKSCIDIDECALALSKNLRVCHGKCMNTEGGYECKCPRGFEKINNQCIDIDECKEKTDNCDRENTICLNLPGSYSCEIPKCLRGTRYVASDQYPNFANKVTCTVNLCNHQACTDIVQHTLFYLVLPENAKYPAMFFQSARSHDPETKIDYEFEIIPVGTIAKGVKVASEENFGFVVPTDGPVGSDKIEVWLNKPVEAPQQTIIRMTSVVHLRQARSNRVERLIQDINIIVPEDVFSRN